MDIITEELAIALINSDEDYPVDFDDAWKWIGYSRKEKGLQTLKSNFEEGLDFFTKGSKSSTGGRPSQHILLTIDCFKSLAMMAGTSQGKKIRRYFLDCEKKLKELTLKSPSGQHQHLWWDRIALFQKHTQIPHGYWTVFMELAYMWMKIEGTGYVFPEKACLDISVGKCWSNYLRSQGYNLDEFDYYPHHYPDHRGIQDARMYPNELLGTFRDWLAATYTENNFPCYMQRYCDKHEYAAIASAVTYARLQSAS